MENQIVRRIVMYGKLQLTPVKVTVAMFDKFQLPWMRGKQLRYKNDRFYRFSEMRTASEKFYRFLDCIIDFQYKTIGTIDIGHS